MLRFCFRAYRAALSPLLGPSCRYHPTCSHYAEEAIAKFGWPRGIVLAAWRLLRCHPFSRGGFDPVPGSAAPPVPLSGPSLQPAGVQPRPRP